MSGIKCGKCEKKLAEVICSCRDLPLCMKHYGEHTIYEGQHPYKNLYFKLNSSQKSDLYQSSITKVKLINSIKQKIQVDTCSIIKTIEILKNSAINTLNQSIKNIQIFLINLCKNKLSKIEHKNALDFIGAEWVTSVFKKINLGNELRDYYNRKFYIELLDEKYQNFDCGSKAETTKNCDRTFCFNKDKIKQRDIRPSTPSFNINERKMSIKVAIIPKLEKRSRK